MIDNSSDLIIKPQWIIPIDQSADYLTDHFIHLKDDKIHAVAAIKELNKPELQNLKTLDLPGHAVLPGFVNAHGHAAMSLFRGMADDMPLMNWLNDHIWPAESKWVNEDFVRDGSKLAIAEMLRSGTTCFADMYFFPQVVADVAHEFHTRCRLNTPVLDFPTVWAQSADEYIHKGLEIHDHVRANALISMAFGPHAPYTVADKPLEKIAMLSEELEVGIHMHVNETAQEVRDAITNDGISPLKRLHQLGLLTPKFQAVHMTQVQQDEYELMASTGMHVVHCPESNLKLASGFCPVKKLRDYDINIAIGTDGAASNNDLDMLSEIRTAALLAKAVSQDASSFSAHEALTAATLGGAKALNLQDQIGSISSGKQADLIAINLHTPGLLPVYNPISQIVYSAKNTNVNHVWVAGRQLIENGHLKHMDEQEIIQIALKWQKKIAH